jgi:predicted DNA-binding transcriptional regulator YafY
MAHRGRRAKAFSQAQRLALMLRTLASRQVTPKELAEQLGVSRRQVHRDLRQLQQDGYPVEGPEEGRDGTWQLPAGYQGFPQIAVTPYEVMALQLARSHLAYLAGTPFLDDLDSVLGKVQAGLPYKIANHLERLVHAFAPLQRPTRSYARQKAVLTELRRALLLQRRIEMTYQKPGTSKPITYRVDPYILVLYQYGLYVMGYSHRARDLRTFAVERMSKVVVTDEAFEIPASFSAAERERRLFGLMDEPPLTVRIRFSPEVAHLLKERQWHPTQVLTPCKDGAVILTMRLGGLEEITAWVLSWGDRAKVLAPPALIRAVRAQLAGAAGQYRAARRSR